MKKKIQNTLKKSMVFPSKEEIQVLQKEREREEQHISK